MVQLSVGSGMGPQFFSLARIMTGVKKRTSMPITGACKHVEGEVQEYFPENHQDKPQSLHVYLVPEVPIPMSRSRQSYSNSIK